MKKKRERSLVITFDNFIEASTFGADPEDPQVVFKYGIHIIMAQAIPLSDFMSPKREFVFLGIKSIDPPGIGPDPENTGAVFHKGHYLVGAQAVEIPGFVHPMDEFSCLAIKLV
jgi:hypothetical protein